MATDDTGAYSPGPWTDRGFEHQAEQRRVILDANGAEVGYVVRGGDAALIVEALEMLALLRDLNETYRLNANDPLFGRMRALLSRLDAAAAGKDK